MNPSPQMARATRSQRLEDKAREMILSNFLQLKNTRLFKQLTHRELISIIRRDDLVTPDEDVVCGAVLTWVNADTPKRKHVLGEILRQVRLPQVSRRLVVWRCFLTITHSVLGYPGCGNRTIKDSLCPAWSRSEYPSETQRVIADSPIKKKKACINRQTIEELQGVFFLSPAAQSLSIGKHRTGSMLVFYQRKKRM